jgi:NADH-quinone oxidoreductase subunit E
MGASFDFKAVDRIIGELGAKPSSIIGILEAIQEEYRYIPPDVFPYLAQKLGVTEAHIYGVATFYENFSLEPKGKFVIKVCDGTACHVRQSVPILNRIREVLGLSETKHTTPDMGFTVETVSCLGACGLAPAMTVNDTVHPAMNREKAEALLKELKAQL